MTKVYFRTRHKTVSMAIDARHYALAQVEALLICAKSNIDPESPVLAVVYKD